MKMEIRYSLAARQSRDQGEDEDDEEYEEKNPSDFAGAGGDAAKAEYR